jgi:MYXO-CTERM domain-containing protein
VVLGTACGGAPVGGCDAQDVCAGTVGASASCTARVAAAGTECRESAGACDVAESCDGASPACPTDGLAPPGTECREAADVCDVAEVCSGGSVLCPVDDFALAGTECRPMMSTCDLAEACDGLSVACPVDGLDPTCDCTLDADCADVSVCTIDACAVPSGSTVGACTNERIAGCCEGDADCADEDGDLCTAPRCDLDANACLEEPVVCNDDDPCTTDACAPADGSCTFDPIPGCGVDAGELADAGVGDAGPVDAGARDSGAGDSGARDGGASDGGAGADAGDVAPAAGCGCRVSARGGTGGVLWLVALVGLALLRRR